MKPRYSFSERSSTAASPDYCPLPYRPCGLRILDAAYRVVMGAV